MIANRRMTDVVIKHRHGRYVYGDDAGSLITWNARGTIKLDHLSPNGSSGLSQFIWKTIVFKIGSCEPRSPAARGINGSIAET